MLKETETGTLEVATFEGQILLTISSVDMVFSCTLSEEDAKDLSSFLFKAWVEAIRRQVQN